MTSMTDGIGIVGSGGLDQPALADVAMKVAEARARIAEREMGMRQKPSRMEAAAIDAAILAEDAQLARMRYAGIARDMAFDGLDMVDDALEAVKHNQGYARPKAVGAGALLVALVAAVAVLRHMSRRRMHKASAEETTA